MSNKKSSAQFAGGAARRPWAPSPSQRWREIGATALPLAGAALAVGVATPPGPLLDPLETGWTAALLLAAVAGSLHRPFESSTLGVGAVALPPLLAFWGVGPAAWVAAGALLAADLVRRSLRRHSPVISAERRRPLRSLEAAGAAMVALVLGTFLGFSLVPGADGRLAPPLLAAGAGYTLVLALLSIADKKLRRPQRAVPWRDSLLPLTLDLAAWGLGIAVAVAAQTAGWRTAGVLLAGIGLLALESARHTLHHGMSEQRIDDLERLTRATRRIAGEGSEVGLHNLAERLRAECANVITCQWFQFELLARQSGYQSWWAGPDGVLRDGEPAPPENPPPLPGIHRRRRWRCVERALETEDQLVGRLRLWCDPRQLEGDSLELLEKLLPQMVASIQRALLDREAKQDPLTGLAVRRVLETQLDKSYRGCLRDGSSMAVLLSDLDFFKRINDTWGHGVGDQALVATAQLLLEVAEEEAALAARYGGEEFVLLLVDADGEGAMEVAERLRRRTEALRLEVEGDAIPLTMSLGVAAFPELHVKRPAELLELADVALYEAKRQGRNRALLHLGRDRFRTADGTVLEGETPAAAPEVPQFFA